MAQTQRYIKKPVIVEVFRFTRSNAAEVAAWCGGKHDYDVKPSDHTDQSHYLKIPTLEGTMQANEGDYIIRGVKGEFYPCKPDIFEQTYTPIPTLKEN